jgi:hypothetical protein
VGGTRCGGSCAGTIGICGGCQCRLDDNNPDSTAATACICGPNSKGCPT